MNYAKAAPAVDGEPKKELDAKLAAAEAAWLAARNAMQVHGAMGYTWEVDLHIWMKRAWALGLAWGSIAWHRERVARIVLDEARDD